MAPRIPFIDVGMGVEEIDGTLSGLLRVAFADPDADVSSNRWLRIPRPPRSATTTAATSRSPT